jgi:predicted membrane protein
MKLPAQIKQILALAASIMFCVLFYVYFIKTHQKEEKEPIQEYYECPVVADTVKHDWVKNPDICIEKRLVYDQMLDDGWR